ncbi:MAG: sporulation protein YunB [Clostridia bacterium]|nr:sporulation protein YunB [Clostridia bacterium]
MVAKRRKKRYERRHTPKKIFIAVLLILTSTLIFFEIRLKPIVSSVAQTYAQSLATGLINESVAVVLKEMDINEQELDIISRSDDGSIHSISSNTVLTNQLKSAVTLKVQEAILNVRGYRLDIPLGTIIGSELLSGRGPSVPVYVSLSGTVDSDFTSHFESGGLNQTVHTLSINVNAHLTIVMPLASSTAEVKTSVPVSENVIVGSVPSGMILRQ